VIRPNLIPKNATPSAKLLTLVAVVVVIAGRSPAAAAGRRGTGARETPSVLIAGSQEKKFLPQGTQGNRGNHRESVIVIAYSLLI